MMSLAQSQIHSAGVGTVMRICDEGKPMIF